ncbi:SIS domain-containing protein [uncultured Metabacillus sp.]|uniref:SIS domain-containing protein n=1 Tax=uncultured Metabacillus sp. TaxID=2860135 RepID=UPI0026066931|nr:SIS domain-containing protein [uncultured Metabacillus sp.]
MLSTYFTKIQDKLQLVLEKESESMKIVAAKIAESIQQGGIIQLFGCGHSHILTEEVFFRAGGLAPIKPILIEPLMLHEGAVKSSQLERLNDYAAHFLDRQDIQPNDVVIVLSTSGINPVPIDVALYAREKGAFVVGICSFDYRSGQTSRHKSGKFLADVVDLPLNNFSVKGDAILSYDRVKVPFIPTSTVIGAAMLNGILAEAIKKIADAGMEPPIFLSGNITGADEHNKKLIQKYSKRIELLTRGMDF